MVRFNISNSIKLVLWWTKILWEWPKPYNTDFIVCNHQTKTVLGKHKCEKSWGCTSLIDNFNTSKLTLGTVMTWDNLRVAITMQNSQVPNFIFCRYQQETDLSKSEHKSILKINTHALMQNLKCLESLEGVIIVVNWVALVGTKWLQQVIVNNF